MSAPSWGEEGCHHHSGGRSAIPEAASALDSCKREELMQCTTATEPPSTDVSSSPDTASSITELPDSPRASRELSNETDAEPGLLSNSPGQQTASPELPVPSPTAAPAPPSPSTAHLMAEAQRRQPRVILTRLALPPGCISCRLADEHRGDSTEPAKRPVPPLLHTGRPAEEAQLKQPRVVLTRLALPPGCISCRLADEHHGDGTEPPKRPTPACTTTKGSTTGHRQHAGSIPATKRKLPRRRHLPGHRRRR